jgi:hypothetical protein
MFTTEMGNGVKALRPFVCGEFIAEYTGVHVASLKEIKRRRQEYCFKVDKTKTLQCYEFEIRFKGKKHW